MRKSILSLVASLAIASSAVAMDNEKVYAVVDGDKITSSDIAVVLRDPRIQFESLPKTNQDQILNSLIEQKLLSKEAMNSNIPKTQEFKDELKKLKETLAFQIMMRDLSKTVKVDEKTLKDFYNKNKDAFKAPLQLKASHILLKTQKEAQDIIAQLKKAKDIKNEFTALAKSKSTGPSGSTGGELGWFTKEKMVPEFSEASEKLKIGSFTKEPVQTQFGYHVIYLDDKKEASTLKFEEVKDKISQQLEQQEFVKMIKDKAVKLREKAKIEYK